MNVAAGLKIGLAVFLWCVEAPYGGELRLHHYRFGLSDFCDETFYLPLSSRSRDSTTVSINELSAIKSKAYSKSAQYLRTLQVN